MGCGESKHAVSTANTVFSRDNSKRSNSTKNTTPQINSPVAKTVNNCNPENDLGNGNVKENRIQADVNKEQSQTDNIAKKNENQGGIGNVESEVVVQVEEKKKNVKSEAVEVVTEQEGELENVEVKEQMKDEVVDEENEEAKAVPVPGSPDDFFSDHEMTIESMIPDGISGKSEYHSPYDKHHQGGYGTTGKEDGVNVGESKGVVPVDETKDNAPNTEEKPEVEKDNGTDAAAPADVVKAK